MSNATLDIEVPDGIELDVSRVGRVITSAGHAKKGETVNFYYFGGSQNGYRTVLVMKSDDSGLEGLTLERDGEYRRYSDSDMSTTINIVKPFVSVPTQNGNVKRIRFDNAVEALAASLTGEQLAELYLKHVAVLGDDAEFDSATGEVVVKLPEPKTPRFTRVISNDSLTGPDITMTNKDGKTFSIWLYTDGTVGLHNDVTGLDANSCTNPEQLRDELVKFLA